MPILNTHSIKAHFEMNNAKKGCDTCHILFIYYLKTKYCLSPLLSIMYFHAYNKYTEIGVIVG